MYEFFFESVDVFYLKDKYNYPLDSADFEYLNPGRKIQSKNHTDLCLWKWVEQKITIESS